MVCMLHSSIFMALKYEHIFENTKKMELLEKQIQNEKGNGWACYLAEYEHQEKIFISNA